MDDAILAADFARSPTAPKIGSESSSRCVDAASRAGKLSEARLYAIEVNLTALVDSCCSCERIVGTPAPFAYAQHIKIFVTLFCFTIPFAIVDVMNAWTPLTSANANDLPIAIIGEKTRQSAEEIASSASR